ncbi:MAG: MarR family winged helix-turn-helix transcriptional regulator [Thermoproteota archaeon]|jgi:MarR family transcriptional regulator for hemolysin|nr:MarR family winged helix-turn-helix transcriptional regulator [Thermoproteota archaeon]
MQQFDFHNSIGFIVNRTAKAFVKALDSELRDKVGVTVGQWKVLVMLVNQNGLTQKEIAKRLGLEGPTLIPIIDKMEKDDLVKRKVDPVDRRNNRIYRTDKADKLWNEMVNCALKIRQVSLESIPKDNIDIARNVLENIYQNLTKQFDVGCAISSQDAFVGPTAGMGQNTATSVSTTLVQ